MHIVDGPQAKLDVATYALERIARACQRAGYYQQSILEIAEDALADIRPPANDKRSLTVKAVACLPARLVVHSTSDEPKAFSS